MPVILAILAAAAGLIYWMMRARAAGHAAQDLVDMAGDLAAAARRFGFRRQAGRHPVEALEEPDVAVAGLGMAMMELGGLPTQEQQNALLVSLQHHLGYDLQKAQEAQILGRWLMMQCGGPMPGFSRLARRLAKLGGPEVFDPCMAVLRDVIAAQPAGISPQQKEALAELALAFKLR
ncbi:hypothetical protein [Gemmobacter sp.]|uniref:hypothetical protein n=1 Tax=Gemmobacter sp. TaxID=1898957 RepID=UPI0025B7C5E7|nr:hypothetical protein [Gemmobacter sp.]